MCESRRRRHSGVRFLCCSSVSRNSLNDMHPSTCRRVRFVNEVNSLGRRVIPRPKSSSSWRLGRQKWPCRLNSSQNISWSEIRLCSILKDWGNSSSDPILFKARCSSDTNCPRLCGNSVIWEQWMTSNEVSRVRRERHTGSWTEVRFEKVRLLNVVREQIAVGTLCRNWLHDPISRLVSSVSLFMRPGNLLKSTFSSFRLWRLVHCDKFPGRRRTSPRATKMRVWRHVNAVSWFKIGSDAILPLRYKTSSLLKLRIELGR